MLVLADTVMFWHANKHNIFSQIWPLKVGVQQTQKAKKKKKVGFQFLGF